MWFLLMLVILLTNGVSSFGLKMLAAWALPPSAKFPYLTLWYVAGFACIGLPMLFKRIRIGAKELVWGGVMAALSIGGQIALDTRVPGHVVFPVAIGGSIFLVALAGWLIFGERMNRMNTLGVALGFLAVVLLGLS